MEKLLALAMLCQNIYGRWLFRRLLVGIIALSALTIIASIITSAVAIGGLYMLYLVVVSYGISEQVALCVTAITGIFIVLSLGFVIASGLGRLRASPSKLMQDNAASHQAGVAIDAFLEGFSGVRRQP